MSYPFFRCVSCHAPVQTVVQYDMGKLPPSLASYRDIPTTDGFEQGDPFRHCRGQGLKYKDRCSLTAVVEYVHGHHFNFSGIFQRYCCFCAMHAVGGPDLFADVACYLCSEKYAVIKAFVDLVYRRQACGWKQHGWAALPSVILDRIVCLAIAGGTLSVEDGVVAALVSSENINK